MLFLLFQLGKDRYALDCRVVVEVLPLVQPKQLPQAPPGVAGLFDYHGVAVPMLDLSQLATGQAAAPRMSTRLVVVRYGPDQRLLGLIAERATDTLRRQASDFVDAGIASPDAAYLGPVTQDGHGLIQRVDVQHLLPPSLQALLFDVAGA